jgi:outer membrane protein assembly factor BamB
LSPRLGVTGGAPLQHPLDCVEIRPRAQIRKDSWGEHKFYFGPATSSIWSTPSFDLESGTIFFGTDVNTAPRRPSKDDPRLSTPESCGVVALSVRDGSQKWVTQINPDDVWTNAMRAYDPKEGRYKDQSIGDTPKVYSITMNGKPTKVVGVGCKNGGFYVLRAEDGHIVNHTPIYDGPPTYPLALKPDPRMLALPSVIGGLQTGCATDGETIYTNGIDAVRLMSHEKQTEIGVPTGGRVVALTMDTRTERWRHERPKVATLGGPKPKPVYNDVGDPVASGVAVANGVVYFTTVASGKLVALDAASGAVLKEINLGPVWSGPQFPAAASMPAPGTHCSFQWTSRPSSRRNSRASFTPSAYRARTKSVVLVQEGNKDLPGPPSG